MSFRSRWRLIGAGFAVVLAGPAALAEPPTSANPALPLVSLDGNSELRTLRPSPIADSRGDKDAAGQAKPKDPPHAPVDPKVLR